MDQGSISCPCHSRRGNLSLNHHSWNFFQFISCMLRFFCFFDWVFLCLLRDWAGSGAIDVLSPLPHWMQYWALQITLTWLVALELSWIAQSCYSASNTNPQAFEFTNKCAFLKQSLLAQVLPHDIDLAPQIKKKAKTTSTVMDYISNRFQAPAR